MKKYSDPNKCSYKIIIKGKKKKTKKIDTYQNDIPNINIEPSNSDNSDNSDNSIDYNKPNDDNTYINQISKYMSNIFTNGKKRQSYNNYSNEKKGKKTKLYNNYSNEKKGKKTKLYNNYSNEKKGKKTKLYNNYSNEKKGKKTKLYMEGSNNDEKKKKKKFKIHTDNYTPFTIKTNFINNLGIKTNRTDRIKKDEVIKKTLNYKWGLGLEHEMQLFHKKSVFKNNIDDVNYGNIIFDSQESSCYLTGDIDEQGSCCKLKKDRCSKFPTRNGKLISPLNKDELEWLSKIDWEITGRQDAACKDGILQRVPVLMPEIISSDHRNRNLGNICDEMINLRKLYINLHKKNPHTQKKIKQYGELITHPCSVEDNILVPDRPTINSNNYTFSKKPMKDYLGSWHITITLPYMESTTNEEFITNHKHFAQALQWIEPLLLTSYFTGDPSSVGSSNTKIKGSFRIMAVGWGNIGGSDVRNFDTTGISRGSNIELYWRNKSDFDNTKKLDKCVKIAKPKYPNALSIQAGDFRTFSFDFTDNCEGHDCPKVDGGKMEKPNGIEIRIFDHFDDKHIHSLLHIIILLAENSHRHNPTDYVYKNKEWIKALNDIMKHGWKTILNDKFINLLKKNLGLRINTEEKIAFRVFETVVDELFKINKHGLLPFLMIDPDNIDIKPKIPSINRICWSISMNEKFGNEIYDHINSIYKKGEKLTVSKFKTDFYKKFNKKKWEKDIYDVISSLELLKYIEVNETDIIGSKNIDQSMILTII